MFEQVKKDYENEATIDEYALLANGLILLQGKVSSRLLIIRMFSKYKPF